MTKPATNSQRLTAKSQKPKALLIALLLVSASVQAWNYSSTDETTTHSAQIRVGAEFNKKWHNGLSLGISEELRFPMYGVVSGANVPQDSTIMPSFGKSYTTLSLGYRPIEYLKFDAGYTLKINGNKDWSDVNKWMKHRVFFSVTGTYKYANWSFSLRERFLTEIRMGDIDKHTATGLYEKNRADWQLRSKAGVSYHVMSKPVKPYLWVELINTLNAPELSGGKQYITSVRTQIGTTWRLTEKNSLDFYYRFTYGYEKDVNVRAKKQTIELTNETAYQHAVGITYRFDW